MDIQIIPAALPVLPPPDLQGWHDPEEAAPYAFDLPCPAPLGLDDAPRAHPAGEPSGDHDGDTDQRDDVTAQEDDTALREGIFSRGMIRLQACAGHSPFTLLADPARVQAAARRTGQLALPRRAVYLFSRKGSTSDPDISRLDDEVDLEEEDEETPAC